MDISSASKKSLPSMDKDASIQDTAAIEKDKYPSQSSLLAPTQSHTHTPEAWGKDESFIQYPDPASFTLSSSS